MKPKATQGQGQPESVEFCKMFQSKTKERNKEGRKKRQKERERKGEKEEGRWEEAKKGV